MAYIESEIESTFSYILSEIEKGRALRSILKDDGMPSSQTFYKWIDADQGKAKQYARATEVRAEAIFEDILDIADDQEDDIYIDKDGKEQVNHNVINRARLRVDSRKWMLGKLNPKKYGDKLETKNEHSGEIKIIREVKK